MHWIDRLEEHRKLLISGLALVCIAIIFVAIRRFNIAPDSYWHLKTGLVWLQDGISPWRDHFSFTYGGKAIRPPIVFDVVIAWLVQTFGTESGFEVFKFVSLALVFGLFLLYLRKLRAPVYVYAIVLPLLAALFQFRAMVRPELLSYSFIVASMLLYYRARNELSASKMLPILVLIVLWVNYHSAIFAYIIFFGLFVDHGFKNLQNRVGGSVWANWLGWGLAVLLAGFLNPALGHPVLGALNFAPEWKDLIQEYTPALAKFGNFYLAYFIYGIFLVTIGMSLWCRKFGLFVVTAILTYYAVSMSRLITPSGIAIACAFAWLMSEHELTKRFRTAPRWLERVLMIGTAGLVGVYIYGAVELARHSMEMNRTYTTGFPTEEVDYMRQEGISGRIFNLYEDGGYLIYRLWPQVTVYIDGRTNILYPLEHSYRYRDSLRYAEVLNEEIDKYDINLAMVQPRKHNFTEFKDSGRLQLDFIGLQRALFRKENANFPTMGTLLARPACWDPDLLSNLEIEQARAQEILPDRSLAFPFLSAVIEYAQTNDKSSYLARVDPETELDNNVRRFLGYRALELGLYDQVVDLVARATDTEFADFLLVALAESRRGNWGVSERVLDHLTKIPWIQVKQKELAILYRILSRIREHAELELFDDEYIDELAAQFESEADTEQSPGTATFCEASY
jgi:hypothetical protein